jgi:nucleotide-binding universal stress UspA family protein
MFTRILVALDFSPPSDAALAYARTVAATFGGALHLLHVVENEFLRPIAADPRGIEDAALTRLRYRLRADDYTRFRASTAVERSDDAADEIVTYARSRGVDLIIMGTHGRTGLAHVLVGSVAERVVRSAPCPVLTLHEAPSPGNALPKRILVPTDFSAPSHAALQYARSVAAGFGASLHVLHVLEEVAAAPAGSEIFVAESALTRTTRLNDARERLGRLLSDDVRRSVTASFDAIFGSRAATIVDYAADNAYDLIVMGTHGRTGVAHLLLGSVAEAVVRTARCPVLTTHGLPEMAHATPATPAGAERL